MMIKLQVNKTNCIHPIRDEILLKEHSSGESLPYDLLLLADPSKENIDSYISHSSVITATHNGETIGCCAFCFLDDGALEIKNIAVSEKNQRKGIGTILLNEAIQKARAKKVKKVVASTRNSSIKQLYLYQKAGFRIAEIKKNFFKDNFSDRIVENGIECVDMIVLTMELVDII